jgi:hypothetical protein
MLTWQYHAPEEDSIELDNNPLQVFHKLRIGRGLA